MGELVSVDVEQVRETMRRLDTVARDFNDTTHLADGYGDVLGHPRLVGAMAEFADSWALTRKWLTQRLDALVQHGHDAANAYECTDLTLATALTSPTGNAL